MAEQLVWTASSQFLYLRTSILFKSPLVSLVLTNTVVEEKYSQKPLTNPET